MVTLQVHATLSQGHRKVRKNLYYYNDKALTVFFINSVNNYEYLLQMVSLAYFGPEKVLSKTFVQNYIISLSNLQWRLLGPSL